MNILFFSAQTYEQNVFNQALVDFPDINITYTDATFSLENLPLVAGHDAICLFVNHSCDKVKIEQLARYGVRYILLRCAGFDHIDLEAVKEFNLAIARVPEYSPYAVAEHALALLMCLNRKIHKAYLRTRDSNFALNGLEGFDIHGKKIGIIGYGKIGKTMAQLLSGFGVTLYIYDPAVMPQEIEAQGHVYASLEDIAHNAHIISLHCTLDAQTHHMINQEFFSQIKQPCILVNSSRGGVIHTEDTIEALRNGVLAGLAIDVYEEEGGLFFQDHSLDLIQDANISILQSMPNVLITGHQAFLTHEALQNIAQITLQNALKLSQGEACWE